MIKILYFVLGIYILIKFINPMINDISKIKTKNVLVEKRIEINKKIFQYKNKIDLLYKKALKEKGKIDKLFFKEQFSQTQVFTSLQKMLKSSDTNKNIQRLNWDNVYIKNNIKYFPITIYLKALPKDFEQFIEKLCKSDKLLFVDYLKINAINKRTLVKYQIRVIGFQKVKNIEKNK